MERKRLKYLFLWIGLGCFFISGAQDKIELQKQFKLPKELKENSGMVYHDSCFWFLNDGGNPPILYKLNWQGEIIKKVRITNAKNHDWEELKRDEKGNYYIGDFGNNLNSRKNLAILKIKGLDTLTSDSVKAKKINFSFSDQYVFPPAEDSFYFDCEAFEVFDNQILLFTKNRTKPYDQKLKIYKLSNTLGTQVAVPWKSFKLPGKRRIKSWVTASCLAKTEILLLSSSYIYHIETVRMAYSSRQKLGKFRQWEAITSNHSGQFFISHEGFLFWKPKLYQVVEGLD